MKKWDKKRIMASILAGLLAFLIVFSVLLSALSVNASAASVGTLRGRLSEIKKKKDKIESQLKDIKSNKKSVNQKKESLDEQIDVAQEEIDATNELIDGLNGQISVKEKELAAEGVKEKAQYELFKKRVRAMYESGDTGYLSVLLSTDDFSSMLSRYEVVSQIMDHDKTLIKSIKDEIEKIGEAKASLESDKKENETLKSSIIQKQAALKQKSADSQKMMEELEKNEEEYKKSYAEYEKEEEKIEKQIEAELANLGGTYVGGVFMWPAPGYTGISSYYGWRYHPILHVYKNHTGVDISAPYGAKVVAANAGTVVISGYNSAYGNYVVINHGGGKATLYAHFSKRLVSKGDTVKKGQAIGLVGATGYATGAHLHFEIRINGATVNPLSYFKKS
ncbi:MAG: peptidoglycan DD-metalloendopeptidase family protein [Bacillota bacterium]|nr:peptidoglycan DD-metalloendopeptidase family protein [Bacillota bacterium]